MSILYTLHLSSYIWDLIVPKWFLCMKKTTTLQSLPILSSKGCIHKKSVQESCYVHTWLNKHV
jgi:hypothetical protein